MGHTSNLNLSWDKRGIREKRVHFPSLIERVIEERKRRAKSFLPRSTEFRWSIFVGPRTKVYRIDKGYVWVYLERRISPKIQEERFQEIEVFGFRRLLTRVSTFKEVWNSSYLVYFPSLGREKRVFRLRVCLAKKKLDFWVMLDVSLPR